VGIPELNARIAIKSPPEFLGKEFVSLILYGMQSKNLVLPHDASNYGLWIPSLETWIKDSEEIGNYTDHISLQKVSECGIDFTLHHLWIDLPSDIVSPQFEKPANAPEFGASELEGVLQFYGFSGKDLIEHEFSKLGRKTIFSRDYNYSSQAETIMMTSNVDIDVPDAKISLSLELFRPLEDMIPRIARKLGVLCQHIQGFYLYGSPNEPISFKTPICQLGVTSQSLLVAMINEEKWRIHAMMLAEPSIECSTSRSTWNEGPNSSENITFEDGTIKCVSLNKLIQYLTIDNVKDFNYCTCFFLLCCGRYNADAFMGNLVS
jgi:hypothetical protein